jgi:hypothetical protein
MHVCMKWMILHKSLQEKQNKCNVINIPQFNTSSSVYCKNKKVLIEDVPLLNTYYGNVTTWKE